MLRSASRSAAQQGGPSAEPQPPERQKEALKVMGKLRATNHSGKRGAGCAHSTKDLEQDEEPSSAQQRAAKKKVRTSSKRYKGVKNGEDGILWGPSKSSENTSSKGDCEKMAARGGVANRSKGTGSARGHGWAAAPGRPTGT